MLSRIANFSDISNNRYSEHGGELGHHMDALFDPDSLRGQTTIEFREERSVDDQQTFDYFASIDGLVAVGITNEAGMVLLMNSPHGWRLPYGPVNVGEDWVSVGQRIGEELTGTDVTIAGAERASKITHQEKDDDGREKTSYEVILGTVPLTEEPVDASPSFGPWDELELGWFDTVPDDAYWDHGDAVDDIRLFIE